MKTIGLIGGLSWYSTAEYYRVINEAVQERRGGHASARIALQSLDFAEVRALQEGGDWAAAGRLLTDAGRRCRDGGADVVLICSNLMHRTADDVAAALDVPLLHVATAVADRVRELGWQRVGLIGSRWVMEEDFYVGMLRSAGLDVLVPGPAEREMIDRVVFEELTRGRIVETSRTAFARVLADLATGGAEGAALACTEIELLVRPEDTPIPLVDSMRVHAEAAVRFALADGDHAAVS